MAALLSTHDTSAIDRGGLAHAARIIRARQSVRRYTDEPIPDDVLKELLRCATLAPSAHNRQPWRFSIVQSPEGKADLAQAMGDCLRRDRLADGDDPATVEADVGRSFARIAAAATVVVGATSLRDMDTYTDARRREAEGVMALQSTAMAVQNLLLAASAAGLGACWMCAPLFCPEAVRHALTLPSDWQPQALITLGFPLRPAQARARLPLHAVVHLENET